MVRRSFFFAVGCFLAIVIFWILSVVKATAQDMIDPIDMSGACAHEHNQDKWELKPNPDIPGEYLFEYTNNAAQCSDTINGMGVEAADGFRVVLYVKVGANENNDELIYIVPEDEAYMPYPAEIYAPDSSESYKIRLIPGMV